MRAALSLAALAAVALAAPITSLPGYMGKKLSMSSGYITVSETQSPTDGRALFYWHIESESSPSTDPLVVWFQGGPGCSGLFGLFAENGPLRVNANGTVSYTNVAWTQAVNMVWIESPAGVGFSYSNNTNFSPNDTQSAIDATTFITNFIEQYPQYKGRDIWLTGESYGGVYVPTTASLFVDSKYGSQLKGIMVGNGVMNCGAEGDPNIQVQIFYWHGLVSYQNYAAWNSNNCPTNPNTDTCNNIGNLIQQEIGSEVQQKKRGALQGGNFPSLDPDDLYQDFCVGNGTLDAAEQQAPSCAPLGTSMQNYLSMSNVQAAIHVAPNHMGPWSACGLNNPYNSNIGLIKPYYEYLFSKGIHVLLYSGDVDVDTVPMWVTQVCKANLTGSLTSAWQPWFVNGHTAGYWEQFETYTYATLKGAGHESPLYQPLTGYTLFQRFLTGQNLTEGGSNALAGLPRPVRQGDILRFLRGSHGF